MLQSDHIFPLKPLNKDLLENSQSVCIRVCVWVGLGCVCVYIYEKTWASFRPSSQMGRSVCVCVCLFFPSASSYSPTLPLLWLSLWILGMCTFTLFCLAVEHVCVFIWFDFYLTQELRRSLSTKARELLQDLCAPALLHACSFQTEWFSIWSTDEMGFFALECSVGVSYFRGLERISLCIFTYLK